MVLLDNENIESSSDNDETSSTPMGQQQPGHEDSGQQQRQNCINNPQNENPEILLKMLIEAWKNYQVKITSNFVMVDLGGYQLFDRLAQWCVQNPQMALCFLAVGLVMFLPVLLLVGFGLSTILMTLTGFLVLEGTLLTILSMMLFGLMGALFIVLIFFGVVTVATYFGFARIYDLYGNVEAHRSALSRYLQKENLRFDANRRRRMENSQDEIVN